jgi:hypothetical protein
MMAKINCIRPIVQVEIQGWWCSHMCAHKFHSNKVTENYIIEFELSFRINFFINYLGIIITFSIFLLI